MPPPPPPPPGSAAGPRPCCSRSRQHPRQRPQPGQPRTTGPSPAAPTSAAFCPGVPCPQPPVSLSRHAAAPSLQCPSVPLSRARHRRLGRPPALRGASPKLLPLARRCCRAVPGCTRTVAGTHTRTARTHTHTHTPAHPSRRPEPAAARTAPRWPPLRPSPPGPGVPGPAGLRVRPAARGAGDGPEEGDAPRGVAVLLRVRTRGRAEPPGAGSRGQPRSPGAVCQPRLPRGPARG